MSLVVERPTPKQSLHKQKGIHRRAIDAEKVVEMVLRKVHADSYGFGVDNNIVLRPQRHVCCCVHLAVFVGVLRTAHNKHPLILFFFSYVLRTSERVNDANEPALRSFEKRAESFYSRHNHDIAKKRFEVVLNQGAWG